MSDSSSILPHVSDAFATDDKKRAETGRGHGSDDDSDRPKKKAPAKTKAKANGKR